MSLCSIDSRSCIISYNVKPQLINIEHNLLIQDKFYKRRATGLEIKILSDIISGLNKEEFAGLTLMITKCANSLQLAVSKITGHCSWHHVNNFDSSNFSLTQTRLTQRIYKVVFTTQVVSVFLPNRHSRGSL